MHAVLLLPVAGARAAADLVQEPAYRSRMVREPRACWPSWDATLPEDVEIRVWDSSAEIRYLVLPAPPPGTDALGEEELAAPSPATP